MPGEPDSRVLGPPEQRKLEMAVFLPIPHLPQGERHSGLLESRRDLSQVLRRTFYTGPPALVPPLQLNVNILFAGFWPPQAPF